MMEQGESLFKAAQARAEVEIRGFGRKFLSDPAYWNGMDEDDTCPRFYRPAREYLKAVYPSYLAWRLDPADSDPHLVIADVNQFAKDTAEYLWQQHSFRTRTDLWNVLEYPKIVESWPAPPEPLIFEDFWSFLWTESEEGELSLGELHERSVDQFWRVRAESAPNQTPQKHPNIEVVAITTETKPSTTSEKSKTTRTPATIHSPVAAARMQRHLDANGISQREFAAAAKTTDRTIRSFRDSGKTRKDIFRDIATAMGTTPEELLKPEDSAETGK
jgi:hypothetical protein